MWRRPTLLSGAERGVHLTFTSQEGFRKTGNVIFSFFHYSSFCCSITARDLLNPDFPGTRIGVSVPCLRHEVRECALLHLFLSPYTHAAAWDNKRDLMASDSKTGLNRSSNNNRSSAPFNAK